MGGTFKAVGFGQGIGRGHGGESAPGWSRGEGGGAGQAKMNAGSRVGPDTGGEHLSSDWERWVNPEDFAEVNGMPDVWHASGIYPHICLVAGAITMQGESEGWEASGGER